MRPRCAKLKLKGVNFGFLWLGTGVPPRIRRAFTKAGQGSATSAGLGALSPSLSGYGGGGGGDEAYAWPLPRPPADRVRAPSRTLRGWPLQSNSNPELIMHLPHPVHGSVGTSGVCLKVGGGAVGEPPPPSGDPELLEAPKAPNKFFGLN